MPETFVLEELDDATRDYLMAVRDAQGEGAPGVFAPTTSALPGCGCIAGPIIIIATLVLTLTDWIGVVYDDPVRVALLQTAGLLVGGWLLFAYFRSKGARGSKTIAGHWVYVDPLHLYEANQEQVKVIRIDDLAEANFTHNYNQGKYQNSVVRMLLGGDAKASVTLNNEQRAEQMVTYLNYLAWARGPEGGGRASYTPAELGGLAKFVAKNDIEPKDHEGNINLNMVELAITAVPEDPKREGRAAPNILPYIVMIAVGVGIFFLMAKVVNPPVRDGAIYEAVIHEPCEPWFLRLYLMDDRNTRHREQVLQRLGREYDEAIRTIQARPGDQTLRAGMIEVLESLKEPAPPVVSLKVTESGGPAGAEARVTKLRDGLVGKVEEHRSDPSAKDFDYLTAQGGIMGEMAAIMPPVNPPPGVTFPKPRTARGIQMIEFAEKPEEARHAHFEVSYQLAPDPKDAKWYLMSVTAEIRTNLDGNPVATYTEAPTPVRQDQLDSEIDRLRDRLLEGLMGKPAPK